MDYLTVKEFAELKQCSLQTIQKRIKEGKICAERHLHPQNKQLCYMIPVTSLSEDLQAKYYKQKRTEAGLLPEVKEEPEPEKKKAAVQRSFEELSADERAEIALWTGILQEWQALRNGYKGSKTEFDKLYVGKCQLEHPEIKVSASILYRKYAAYKNSDVEGLIDKRGAWNRGKSEIPDPVWNYFLYCYLDENQPSVSECYRDVICWTEEFYPELCSEIPTERSFRRHIEKDIEYAVKVYMRDGEKAFNDRCAPYMIRMYDNLEANDCWIADNHTLDIMSFDGEIVHRLYLTAFLDAKSGVITGWNITESPCSDSTILALRYGIMRFGIPKSIYMDNGREFLNHDIAGMGHRKRKSMEDQPDPPPIFARLSIEMENAIVKNARAKPIERTFRIVKEQFSKCFTGFCGGAITERPESLNSRIKSGNIPADHTIRETLEKWIDGVYNCQEYGGSELKFKGMTRIEVWNKTIKTVRKAAESHLNLMLMRSSRIQKIKRNGVFITYAGEKLWYMDTEETLMNLEREVYVRYDPASLKSVRIYEAATDKFLLEWQIADALMADFLDDVQENIASGQKRIMASRKFIRNQAKGITDELDNEKRITRLDMMLRRAEENRDKFRIEMPKNIVPIMASEEVSEVKKAVGSEINVEINISRIIENAAKRKE